ncbi:MAG: hypothetical protein F2704_06040 [Actinobacteria bacterium]|nr:hypothetical protein [Actinomycetota bacterium]MSX24942.1 hypothetical protein [Actinomycetota bacterium]MSY46252.1 hypothetical protein [Actinomycetota bacterium]MSY57800.1 hypothetical protein [Actinomycetota bacterium]MTB00676.1 hypothetical protein [Actinomycetota bacterium]
MPDYIPGSCNIGAGEIRRRQFVAVIGLFFSAFALIGFITGGVPRNARLSIFFPLMIASVGWVQSRKKFCLAYGFMGTFNFGKLGQISRVADSASRAADRTTALVILGQASGLALVATLIVYALA